MPDLRFESLRNVTLALGNVKLQLPDEDRSTTIFGQPRRRSESAAVDERTRSTAVTLTLSKGPPTNVKVPNLSTWASTRRATRRKRVKCIWGKSCGRRSRRGSGARNGRAAVAAGGQLIDPFTLVSLQVSAVRRNTATSCGKCT